MSEKVTKETIQVGDNKYTLYTYGTGWQVEIPKHISKDYWDCGGATFGMVNEEYAKFLRDVILAIHEGNFELNGKGQYVVYNDEVIFAVGQLPFDVYEKLFELIKRRVKGLQVRRIEDE